MVEDDLIKKEIHLEDEMIKHEIEDNKHKDSWGEMFNEDVHSIHMD